MTSPARPAVRSFPLRLDRLAGVGPRPGAAVAPQRPVLRPQQPLAHAHANASQPAAPSVGLGLDSVVVRRRMVQRLRRDGLSCDAVLDAIGSVPRHLFVDAALVTQAYEDTSLPIGHGQTISKPSVVAHMIALLFGGANAARSASLGKTLEIGTGCGYQAAVLALLARQVVSVERLLPLHDKAWRLLAPVRPLNLRLVYGDGMLGHAPNAPYDSIIAAAGGDALPSAWLDQLAVGGRLVSPLQEPADAADAARRGAPRQVLVVVDRTDTGYRRSVHEAVQFVPLRSGVR